MNDIKVAARTGDAQAIAQLMNASFQPKGISVKVARSGPVLKVLMESASLPDRKLAGAVRKGLDGIKPAGVEKVFLKAQSNGGEAWTEQWNLDGPQPVVVNDVADKQPETNSKDDRFKENAKGHGTISLKFLLSSVVSLTIFFYCAVLIFGGGWERIKEERAAGQSKEQTEEQAPAADSFAEGIESATNAANLAQTAESEDEWQRTSNLWNAAIEQMKAVQADSQNSAIAQQKIVEYEKNRQYAADRAAALEAQRQQEKAWYEGGTLHKASALDWQNASYENKLATCADFVASARQEGLLTPQIAYKSSSPEGLRALSEELVAEMDIAMERKSDPKLNEQIYANQTVGDMAAAIIVLSGWVR